jgi:hypothetical protein
MPGLEVLVVFVDDEVDVGEVARDLSYALSVSLERVSRYSTLGARVWTDPGVVAGACFCEATAPRAITAVGTSMLR